MHIGCTRTGVEGAWGTVRVTNHRRLRYLSLTGEALASFGGRSWLPVGRSCPASSLTGNTFTHDLSVGVNKLGISRDGFMIFYNLMPSRFVGDQKVLWTELKREWHQRDRERGTKMANTTGGLFRSPWRLNSRWTAAKASQPSLGITLPLRSHYTTLK
jgi:hypothetical protein